MVDPRGFLNYPRREPPQRSVEERIRDWQAVERSVPLEELLRQAARCMDCGTPFCHSTGCPLGNFIPELNELVRTQKWREALELLLATNPFAEFTGLICPAPCEASCVNAIDSDPVTIRCIEHAIIERAFQEGYIAPAAPTERFAERVAVVGSGPAGLAVADAVNKAGYNVTVYEAAGKPGGILRYGIPDFKLEKWIVDRRVELMRREGVAFQTGVRVGDDVSYTFLKKRYHALCLTCGARKPRDLPVPGRDLTGIHFALPYLIQQNRINAGEGMEAEERITASGKHVVVIGGGDTGSDCVGTAVRQGAVRVLQFEIMPKPPPRRSPRTPWPQWPYVLRTSTSHEEGCERRWGVSVKEFFGEEGHVAGLRGVEVRWRFREDGSAPVMEEVPGTEFEEKADMVLLAMGFVGFESPPLLEALGVRADKYGRAVRKEDGSTEVPGVFVAGDMSLGASLVVRAIADGLRVGQSVVRYLGRQEAAG